MCGICGKGKNTFLCKKCENKLKSQAIWGQDQYQDKYFETHFYLFSYEQMIRNLILDYKFNEKTYLYHSLITFFQKYQKKYLQFEFYDIIIPVPISQKRKKERGYNQSLLLAKEIAKEWNSKLETKALKKVQNNIAQSKLDRKRKRTKCEKCVSNDRT